jgi:membrane associated rhomboid family serine protease
VIPLRDDVPTRSFPLVTVALIAANVLVYGYELALWLEPGGGAAGERYYVAFIHEFGLIPCRLGVVCPPALETALAGAPAPVLTVFTSMFLHGGLFHLAGNMLYLWIFGNNVEDAMGRGRFLLFYLVCGVAAAAAQYLRDPGSPIPMVGASGAVSGALGAYLLLHPHAHVWTLVVFGFFWRIVPIPALVVLGFWIVVQAVNGLVTFGSGQPGGVAFLAHVGGFLAGLLLVNVFRRRPRPSYRA